MNRLPPSSPQPPARAEIAPGLWLDARLALWVRELRLLVIADLHWGYAASHRARGHLLPWWGDDQIEAQLGSLLDDYRPAEMLWVGDVVHAAEGSGRAEGFLRQASVPVTVLAGNHDRRWARAGERNCRRGRFFFHHGDGTPTLPEECVEVIGHHHPAAAWGDAAGSRLKVPALVAGPRRLILPAFSPWAAGTPWNDRLAATDTLWAITPGRIFPLRQAVSSPLDHAV